MKSLQTALELYKNQFGVYPGDFTFYDDDINFYISFHEGSLEDAFQPLVDNKFISKIPHAPNYPNNCTVDAENCYESGYVLNYLNHGGAWNMVTCGRQKSNNYTLYIMANNKKMDLPRMEIDVGGGVFTDYGSEGVNYYCLGM